jgi:hypothetical protein
MANPRGGNEHPDPRHDVTDRVLYALVAETAAEVPGIVDLLCGVGPGLTPTATQ